MQENLLSKLISSTVSENVSIFPDGYPHCFTFMGFGEDFRSLGCRFSKFQREFDVCFLPEFEISAETVNLHLQKFTKMEILDVQMWNHNIMMYKGGHDRGTGVSVWFGVAFQSVGLIELWTQKRTIRYSTIWKASDRQQFHCQHDNHHTHINTLPMQWVYLDRKTQEHTQNTCRARTSTL